MAPAVLLVLLVPGWTAALLSMGWAQWLVLRRVIPRSARGVPVTSGAGLLGIMVVIGLTTAPNAWPVWRVDVRDVRPCHDGGPEWMMT